MKNISPTNKRKLIQERNTDIIIKNLNKEILSETPIIG